MPEFLQWQETQDSRYELIGGRPVRMMAGARNVHDDIVINILAEFRNRLRGRPCRPFSGDGAVGIGPAQLRRPDAGIDCGPRDPDGLTATRPVVVAEVLSPSTRDFDAFEKTEQFKTIASIEQILLVEPNAAEVTVWARQPDSSWARSTLVGLDQVIELPAAGISLPVAEIYAGVAFPSRPRLVTAT